eukprot:6180800-Pleurochrysis_carterae.AAC.2
MAHAVRQCIECQPCACRKWERVGANNKRIVRTRRVSGVESSEREWESTGTGENQRGRGIDR